MNKKEAERANFSRKRPVLGPIWENGRTEALRFFLDHNKWEERDMLQFSPDEVRFVLAALDAARKAHRSYVSLTMPANAFHDAMNALGDVLGEPDSAHQESDAVQP